MRVGCCFLVALCLCGIATPGRAIDEKVPVAPLPAAIVHAKSVFVSSGNGGDQIYDLFYNELKTWGKYTLVGSPDEAELVFEISFGSQGEPPKVYTNPANLRTYSYTIDRVKLVIYDAKTKNSLWTATETPERARREKNQEKNRTASVKKLVENLKQRVDGSH